ncbi:MAG: ATP-binding cassette domain-containing protein, partial [Terriglobales bacterium]
MGGEGGADDASCTAVTPVLDIRELSVAYGATEALRGLELRVAPGEAVGLCGPSGCGKSSVAYAALGILPGAGRIASGRIEIEGADVTRLSPRAWRRLRAARVALAAQEPGLALNPVRRVCSQIASVLRAHGWGRAAARRRAEEVLEEMGLPAAGRFARAFPHQLSGGQLQRVVLAQALACGPALLIADEPATGLDAVTRDQVLAVLRRRVQAGMALLL